MRDEDGGDLAVGAEAADALQELHRHEATTIPDHGASFGEQEDGGLTNGNRWIKLDAKDARVRAFRNEVEGRVENELPLRCVSLTGRTWVLPVV